MTLFTIFYDLSLSRNPLLKPKNREIRGFDFLNCESTCDLTDVQASIYDRKIGRKRETTHMRLSATDRLRLYFFREMFDQVSFKNDLTNIEIFYTARFSDFNRD